MNREIGIITWRERLQMAEAAARLGNLSAAKALYQQSVTLAKTANDTDYVTTLIHLADFCCSCNDFSEAEPLYREAATVYERSFGPRSFIGAICWRSLAETLHAMGRITEAEAMQEKAMEIFASFK